MIHPPKMSPLAFVSLGIGDVRRSSSPSGYKLWLVNCASLFRLKNRGVPVWCCAPEFPEVAAPAGQLSRETPELQVFRIASVLHAVQAAPIPRQAAGNRFIQAPHPGIFPCRRLVLPAIHPA